MWLRLLLTRHIFLDWTWKEENHCIGNHWCSISIGWYFLIQLEKRNNQVATICWWCEVASHCGLWSDFASQQYKYTLLHCLQIQFVTLFTNTLCYYSQIHYQLWISNRIIHQPAKKTTRCKFNTAKYDNVCAASQRLCFASILRCFASPDRFAPTTVIYNVTNTIQQYNK